MLNQKKIARELQLISNYKYCADKEVLLIMHGCKKKNDDPLPILRLPGTIHEGRFPGYWCPRTRR